MKIINLPRGKGKTTAAIHTSAETGYPILCPHDNQRRHLLNYADNLRLVIPHPITISELESEHNQGKTFEAVIIDEATWILSILLRRLGVASIHTITLSEEDPI